MRPARATGQSPSAIRVASAAGPAEAASSTRARLLCAGVVLIASLAVYTFTLAPTVTLVDSGELIVAARALGVAHPPGFPLYVLLAHLATLVPVGNVAERVNFASAFFAALTIAVLSALSAEILLGLDVQTRRSPRRDFAAAWAPVVLSALLMAGSNTLWSYATVAEVYTLNTLLVALILLLMLRWRRALMARRNAVTASAGRWLYAAAFVFGLALGVHHVTVGLTLPGIAVLVYATDRRVFTSRVLLFATLCALAGLSIYLYLPLAASRAPVLDWGDPRTLQRLWWHVTGRQFQSYFSLAPERMAAQVATFVAFAAREFGPPWLPLGLALSVAGFSVLFQRDRPMFWCLLLMIVADVVYASSYEIAEDKAAYYLPAFMSAALAAGVGARWGIERVASLHARWISHATAAALLLVPVIAFAANLRFNDHRHDFIAHDYVENILDAMEPGGMLLTQDWQVCSPLLYVRSIEQRRRDAVVIDLNLMRRSWYFDYLAREYPEVMHQASDAIDAFLEDLRGWENDPGLYQRDRALNERIDSRFTSLILALITTHLGAAPVYVTEDVLLNPDVQTSGLTKALTSAYQFVPQGLVFQAFPDRSFHPPTAPPLRTRGLADGTRHFAADDVVPLKVLPVYVTMLYNRGRYLAMNGRRTEAVSAFQQSLSLNPSFQLAQRALADSLRPPARSEQPH